MKPARLIRQTWSRVFPTAASRSSAYIQQGNAARDRQDWAVAATTFRAAVELQPHLVPIWIQLGHALKEQGLIVPAIGAYREAALRRPDLAEVHIFLAHLHKQLDQTDVAIAHFIRALHAGESSTQQCDELLRLLGRHSDMDRSTLAALLGDLFEQLPPGPVEATLVAEIRSVFARDLSSSRTEASPGANSALVFDISDLIGYFAHSRLPTGIQRVQIETIEGALARGGDRDVRLCCFIDGRDEWFELPLETMREIARLSTAGSDALDPEWTDAVARLRLFLSLTGPFEFPRGASLVNLGTSWWLQNYFLLVRHAKTTRGIRYIPFVHDMIPVMAPEHCTQGVIQDFISWVTGVFDHADHFLVNSNSTRRDLIKVAAMLGHELDDSNVAVIPLDGDFRKSGSEELPDAALERWALEPDDFVLFVSTIESRKGHLTALEAWAELIARHGPDAVPQLVCVGNRGWHNDDVYDRLASDPALSAKVSTLSHLSDDELGLLYRTCRFTLYPSLYEGWGLPVTEALCHGKVPLISNAASLPEAGGEFAVYFPAGSACALTDEAERLILDDAWRRAAETRIATGFRPRSWSEMAGQIADELDRFVERDAQEGGIVIPPPPTAKVGSWHPITRTDATRIWRGMRVGEGFRSNLGWEWPEARGCRVRREGGELTVRLAGPHPRLRLRVELLGDDCSGSLWTVRCGETAIDGELEAREPLGLWFDVAASEAAHDLSLRFDTRRASDGQAITYFVRGFLIVEAADATAHQHSNGAVTDDQLEALSAFADS